MKHATLITGASRGIGFHTAKTLVSRGSHNACVVMVARDAERLGKAVESVKAVGSNCEVIGITSDLSDPDNMLAIYEALDAKGIALETIINNAGFTKPASINETDMADFEETMRVNLYSPFRLIQLALHRSSPLKKIINVASTAGMNGRAGWLTYSASKAALINMSEVLREELTPYGIDVTCISPGRCATDLRRKLAPNEDPSTIMQPEQVSEIIHLLLSETGQLINSQNLVVRA